jgi:hypothetical protein
MLEDRYLPMSLVLLFGTKPWQQSQAAVDTSHAVMYLL